MNAKKILAGLFALTLVLFSIDFSWAKGGSGFSGGGRSFSGGKSFSGGGKSFGSSKSFGSGSKNFGGGWSKPSLPSRPSSPSVRPSTPKYTPPSTSRKSPDKPSKPAVGPPVSAPRPSTKYDESKQKAVRQEASRKAYETSRAKEQTSKRPAVSPKTNEQDRQRIRDLQRDLNYERMRNREERQRQTFGSYYSRPIERHYYRYNDGINIWFWLWILDRPRYDRDLWLYHHRDTLDAERYAELRRKDTDLDRRLKDLESQGVKKDSSYIPPGIDRDLMYSDEKVKQVYDDTHRSSFPWGLMFGLLIASAFVYLFFFAKIFRRRR